MTRRNRDRRWPLILVTLLLIGATPLAVGDARDAFEELDREVEKLERSGQRGSSRIQDSQPSTTPAPQPDPAPELTGEAAKSDGRQGGIGLATVNEESEAVNAGAGIAFTRASRLRDQGCSGGFFDLIDGGSCWSCPTGHDRTVFAVDSAKACERAASTSFKKATDHGKGRGIVGTDCGRGQFWDPNGRCYSCPENYSRTTAPVTSARSCERVIRASFKPATRLGGMSCPDGAFFDPIDGGTCWRCPAGSIRGAAAVNSGEACVTSPEVARLLEEAKRLEQQVQPYVRLVKSHFDELIRQGVTVERLNRAKREGSDALIRLLKLPSLYRQVDRLPDVLGAAGTYDQVLAQERAGGLVRVAAGGSGARSAASRSGKIVAGSLSTLRGEANMSVAGGAYQDLTFFPVPAMIPTSGPKRLYGYGLGHAPSVEVGLVSALGFWTDRTQFGDMHGFSISGSLYFGINLSFYWMNDTRYPDVKDKFAGFIVAVQTGVNSMGLGGGYKYIRTTIKDGEL